MATEYVAAQCIFLFWFFAGVGIELLALYRLRNQNSPYLYILGAFFFCLDLFLLTTVVIPGQGS